MTPIQVLPKNNSKLSMDRLEDQGTSKILNIDEVNLLVLKESFGKKPDITTEGTRQSVVTNMLKFGVSPWRRLVKKLKAFFESFNC